MIAHAYNQQNCADMDDDYDIEFEKTPGYVTMTEKMKQ